MNITFRSGSARTFVALAAFAASFSACTKDDQQQIAAPAGFCLTDTLTHAVTIDTARLLPLQNELKLTGKVVIDEEKVVKVYPVMPGNVAQLRVELGDYVKQGEVLAVIKSGEVADMERQLLDARSDLQVAQKNLDVATDLFKAGLSSERDFITAKKELQMAQAALSKLNKLYTLYGIGKESEYVIKAPISGFIVDKNVNQGMQVRTDNPESMVTISGLEDIWVQADVYESDISKVKVGYLARVSTMSYPDKVFEGKVDKIYNLLDPVTKVLKVRVKLKNTDYLLKPEMFANVKVSFSEEGEMLAVPAKAVIFDKNKHFLMVYNDRCNIETRKVEVFRTVGPTAYVTGNLKQNEKLISTYQLLVYDALNDQ